MRLLAMRRSLLLLSLHALVLATSGFGLGVRRSWPSSSALGLGRDVVPDCDADRSRRRFLSLLALLSGTTGSSPASAALWGKEKRQLELCLVSVLRVKYWAMNVSAQIHARLLSPKTKIDDDDDEKNDEVGTLADAVRKGSYLEARCELQ